MKKLLCLLLTCGLCACALSGCNRSEGGGSAATGSAGNAVPAATAVPEVGSHGEEDQSQALLAMPTLPPAEPLDARDGGESAVPEAVDAALDSDEGYFDIDALLNGRDDDAEAAQDAAQPDAAQPAAAIAPGSIDPNTYQYSALTDTSLGLTFNYPSHWINVPGVYTVCFKAPAESGEFPARVAISVKKLVHTPDETAMTEQMTAYMRIIHKQYDNATFESGTPNLQDSFLEHQAMSNTYLAYWGDTEVKGFIIGTAVGRVMCVFHFCASYEDYTALEGVMRYMLRSVQVAQNK